MSEEVQAEIYALHQTIKKMLGVQQDILSVLKEISQNTGNIEDIADKLEDRMMAMDETLRDIATNTESED